MTTNGPLRLVVGTGYLGSRVARAWISQGDRVTGTTRSADRAGLLADAGISPIVLDVTTADWIDLFASIGPPVTIFWSVGFDRMAGPSYHDVQVASLGRMLDAIAVEPTTAPPCRIIFCSSTGVWGDETGEIVDETTPVNPSREAGQALVAAEALLRGHAGGPGTALRFAGLYGPGRLPRLADLRAARPIAADPDTWLNLIHIDDAARVVAAVAAAPAPAPLYVVSDGHPIRRRDWYARLAELSGSPTPVWDPTTVRSRGGDKRVNPTLLFTEIPITLDHPDPLAALAGML
jgi:nucleoside-diphosphate-sugar epimerase